MRDNTDVTHPTSDWYRMAVAVMAGVVAAMLIGKFPPNLSIIQNEFQISSALAGTMAAIFNIVGALFGALTGAYSDRLPPRRMIKFGMLALIAEGLLGAIANDVFVMLASRVLGGFGFIAVIVTVPRLIRFTMHDGDRRFALGLWGTFMPTGIVLGMLLNMAMADVGDWRTLWLVIAGLQFVYFVFFTIVFREPLRHEAELGGQSPLKGLAEAARVPQSWLLAVTFTCYTIQWFTIMIWLPTLMHDLFGKATLWVGLGTAAVIGGNIIGNVMGTYYLKHFHHRFFLILFAFLSLTIVMVLTFHVVDNPLGKLALMFLFSTVGGAIPPALLEGASAMAPRPAVISTMNGFIMQGSNTGAILGPPAVGLFLDLNGTWDAMWHISLIASAIGIMTAFALYKIEHRHD